MHLLLSLAVLLSSAAPVSSEEAAPDHKAAARERYLKGHGEWTFGFFGEWRDETAHNVELTKPNDLPMAAALVTPFTQAPFSNLRAAGPMVEGHTIYDGVRFTLGLRFPFAGFRAADTQQVAVLNGVTHDVLVRSLSFWELRTGIGYELPFRRVTPFIDVLGDVTRMSASMVLDGVKAEYGGTAFGLGGRFGLRVQLSEVFIQLAGEATVLGYQRYGGSLLIGVAM